jgi:hypothetical protein
MAEEKIIQHAENAVHVLKDKKSGWKNKLKNVLQEILIIILAVSITLTFHNWNDHRKERQIEKDFLTGIRNDLKEEKNSLADGIKSFQPTIDFYDTAWKRILKKSVTSAFIDTNSGYLLNTLYFVFDKGRFEGFKSSGYLRLIENQELQKHLITLYTSDMPFEEKADEDIFRDRQKDFIAFIGSKVPLDSAGMHISKIIDDPSVRFQIARYVGYFAERKRHKQQLIGRIDNVINEIDKELGD